MLPEALCTYLAYSFVHSFIHLIVFIHLFILSQISVTLGSSGAQNDKKKGEKNTLHNIAV